MGLRYSFLYFIIWNAQNLASAHRISDSTVHKFLGESVIFAERENIPDVALKKNGAYLLRSNRVVNQGYVGRLTFHGNRTLKLDRLEERDAGPYEVELFDVAGRPTHRATITIIITLTPSGKKNGSVVARLNRSGHVYSGKPGARVEMLPTGECRLARVHISDAGNHTLEISDGHRRLRWSARLVVRVPEPVIKHTCLSDGRAEYRCLTEWQIPTLWILKGGSPRDGDSESDLVLNSFTGELLCVLKEYPERNASVSFICTAAMVPQEVIRVCELTDMDTLPPLRHSLLEEEKIYSRISQPAEMSTFFY
ncbi:hypothetical protein SKAU_G00365550 [Synaphobranchus kaupii]|uniref:Ig-like domain-containing protein n=1 Tax=Synaphobranchus kaupii TaxID=118154 RepID=A0A9Q1IFC9_SYNKA|nr:hypothetical protein SKAU_G00365550 [Synaphobranchus kaupii]